MFPVNELYRPSDPWFGRTKEILIKFAVGLRKTQMQAYERVLFSNHYDKFLYFDEFRLSYVYNSRNEIEYEVVYVTVVDIILGQSRVNNLSAPQQQSVDLLGRVRNLHDETYRKLEVNDLFNMRNILRTQVGYIPNYSNLIPKWQLAAQPQTQDLSQRGAPVGFVPTVVMAYAKPGCGERIRQRLSAMNLNFIRFEFDRYQIENYLTQHYNPVTNRYTTPTIGSYDNGNTVFDNNSMRFIENIDYYADPRAYDKYLKYPKSGVFK